MSINVKCVGCHSAFIPINICGIPNGYGICTGMFDDDLKYLIFDTSRSSKAQYEAGRQINSRLSTSVPKSVLITRKANVVGDKDCIQQTFELNGVALPSNWITRLAGICPDKVYSDEGSMAPSTLIEGRSYYDILIPCAKDPNKTYTLAKNVVGIIGFDFSRLEESLTINGLGRGWDDAMTASFSITFSHKGGTLCIGFSSEQIVEDYDGESLSYPSVGTYARKMYMYLNSGTYSLRNNTLRGSLLAGDSPALIRPLDMYDSFAAATVDEYGEPDGKTVRVSEKTSYRHIPNGAVTRSPKKSVEECNFFSRITSASPSGFMEGDIVYFLPEIPFRRDDVDGVSVARYYDPENWRSIIRLPQLFVTPATLSPDELAQDVYDVDSILSEYHAGGFR